MFPQTLLALILYEIKIKGDREGIELEGNNCPRAAVIGPASPLTSLLSQWEQSGV